jgi:hypothetical protein
VPGYSGVAPAAVVAEDDAVAVVAFDFGAE